MPVNEDTDGRRWLAMEFTLPGTPEQVWDAIATGPGIAAWFVPAVVEQQVGGRVEFDMGDGTASKGVVTVWEPPHRFACEERDWNGEAPPLGTEFIVTAQSGGTCVVRLVHSLFASDEQWDDQLESFEGGWPGFFAVLRVYLTHFAGQPAVPTGIAASQPSGDRELRSQMMAALNLTAAKVGEHREAPERVPGFAGVVERVCEDDSKHEVMLRLEVPGDGVALIGSYDCGEQSHASISLYFYGEGAAETAWVAEGEWKSWLTGLLEAGSSGSMEPFDNSY